MIGFALVFALAAAEPSYSPGAPADPVRMSPAEIVAYNAKLRTDHPRYVYCIQAPASVSPTAVLRDCRTNLEWARSGLLSGRDGTLVAEPNPKKLSQSEIRANNARVTATDPYFIKCVRSEPIGSLVATNFSCRTNRQWNTSENSANDEARAILDEMASKFWRTSN